MTSQYTHKLVDGVEVPLTQAEIDELEARDVETVKQRNVSTPNPGYGPTIKQTLVPPPTQGPR